MPGHPVLAAAGLVLHSATADHVQLELCHDRVARHCGVVGEEARAEVTPFLAGVPDEQNRALRLLGERRDPLGDLEERYGARPVVVGSIVDRVRARCAGVLGAERRECGIHLGLLFRRRLLPVVVITFGTHDVVPDAHGVVVHRSGNDSDVVAVRTDRDVLPFELGIAARHDGDDVARSVREGLDIVPHADGCRGARHSESELLERDAEHLRGRTTADEDSGHGSLRSRRVVQERPWTSEEREERPGETVQRDQSRSRCAPGWRRRVWPAPARKTARHGDHHELTAGLFRRERVNGVADHAAKHDWQRWVVERLPGDGQVVGERRQRRTSDGERRGSGVEAPVFDRYGLKVGAAIAGRHEPDAPRLPGDVLRCLQIADGPDVAPQHRIVSEDVQPGLEIAGSDRGDGRPRCVFQGPRGLGERAHGE